MTTQINRRRLLQGLGLGALATRGYAKQQSAPAYFTHNVASGDPLSDRVILWTRVIPENPNTTLNVRWQVAQDRAFMRVVAAGEAQSLADRDYIVKVDATGLLPGTAYFYRFSSLGVNSETGQTKTLPVGQVASFRMGVASCSNYPQGFFNAYRHMADTDLDVVLHLGDYIYEYPEAGYANDYARNVLKRNVVPKHEVLALEDYRMRYGLYRTDPDLQAVHQRHPFICVWDDHELANNTWQDGAENHNDGEGDFYQRMRAARQAYDEWMPIRTHASGDQGPIYRRFAVGNLADLIMLDTRLEGRDRGFEYAKDMVYLPQTNADEPRKPDVAAFRAKLQDPTRTLLGAKQEAWLSDSVARSTSRGATWQVLGQQILMGNVGIPKLSQSALADSGMSEQRKKYTAFMQALGAQGLPLNLDAWDGYPACRDRIAKMLAEAKANTVALAGDTHNAWAFDLNDSEQRSIGVEVGTPGISSPGMENYLPVPGEELVQALKDASPGLVDVDTSRRGWSEITLTPQAMRNRWHFVSTVLDRRFDVQSSPELVCLAGERRFS